MKAGIAGIRTLVVCGWMIGASWASGSATNPPVSLGPVLPVLEVVSTNLPMPAIFQAPETLAQGFQSPDGLALDAETGDLYLTDEDASAIVRIRPDGTKRTVLDSRTPIYEVSGTHRTQVAGLRSPEGLALDEEGRLYVAEDVPGGRLLVFDIRGPIRRSRMEGEVVRLPLQNSRFAWESIAIGPKGELLLAGSSLEDVAGADGGGDLFMGVILHRDASGDWWLLLNHAMTSYSGVCFSPDGRYALMTAEIPGLAGCVDLRTRMVRTFLWDMTFHSPEGVCSLPGGAFLVAEESGKIFRMDPTSGGVQLVYEHDGTVESVLWDAGSRRLLLTDDRHGQVVAVPLKRGEHLRRAAGKIDDIAFIEEATPVDMVPRRCPDYLAEVLKLGGYDPEVARGGVEFQQFAKRYCLVAVDAAVNLMPGHPPVEDPIERIQFVVIAPYLVGYQEGELLWSSSGFTVVMQSGRTMKTELVKRQVIGGDLMEARFTPVGGSTIALPMPFSARINSEGHVAVNFLGMGVMADFYLVLDTNEPDNSLMVVVQPNGFVHQYQLSLPPRRRRSHWVIALERQGPDTWRNLPMPR